MARNWRRVFPVGVFADLEKTVVRDELAGAGTVDVYLVQHANATTGTARALNHPDSGLHANNLDAICWANTIVDPTPPDGLLESLTTHGRDRIRVVAAPMNNMDSEWFTNEGIGHTDQEADAIAGPIAATLDLYPIVIGANLWDDTGTTTGTRAAIMSAAIARASAEGVPATAGSGTDGGEAFLARSDVPALLIQYEYPCSIEANGTDTPEGDLHGRKWNNGQIDYADMLATWVDVPGSYPRHATRWAVMQAHQLRGVPYPLGLRYPTPRELRLIFWVTLGFADTVKGLFWFQWPDQIGVWDGLGHVNSAARMAVVRELADRLTPGIRRKLLACSTAPTQPFTASGGGSGTSYPVANYANAFIRALYDAGRGTHYVVVANHDDAAADITISSASLRGDLENLETGETKRLPATVNLPAFDGSIWVHKPAYGVPRFPLDYGEDAETAWARHWANPDGPNYRPREEIDLHPRTVFVAVEDDIEAVVNAAPDYTTFVLEEGFTHTGKTRFLAGRNGMHFVSDNPANPAQISAFSWYGHSILRDFGYTGSANAWVAQLTTGANADARRALLYPNRDYVFRDLAWVSDGTYYDVASNPYSPVVFFALEGVLVEGCTFSGYKITGSGGNQAGAPSGHPGLVGCSGGVENVVVRGCTLTGATNLGNFGWPWAVYMDGGRGCAIVDNDLAGKWHEGAFLLLTNDDITWPYVADGLLDHLSEERNAKYLFVYDNRSSVHINIGVSLRAERCVIAQNEWNGQTANGSSFVQMEASGSRLWTSHRHSYLQWDNVVRDNDVRGGGYTAFGFVRHIITTTNVAESAPAGRTTVTGNRVTGTVTDWAMDSGEPSTTPHVVSGNISGWVP